MVNNQNFFFVKKSSLYDPIVNQKTKLDVQKIQRSGAKMKTENNKHKRDQALK